MLKDMIREVKYYFPLFIENIIWNNVILKLEGKNWNFSTTSSWRIVFDNTLDFACFDREVLEALKKVETDSIISIEVQSSHLPIDPVFQFSNGCKLEVFTTSSLEPWNFRSPSGVLYVASLGN